MTSTPCAANAAATGTGGSSSVTTRTIELGRSMRAAPVPGNLLLSARTVTSSHASAIACLTGTCAIVVSRRSPLAEIPLTPRKAWSARIRRSESVVRCPETQW